MDNITNVEKAEGIYFVCAQCRTLDVTEDNSREVHSSSIDRMLDDMMIPSGECDTPPTPVLPWWFTPECESQLLAAAEPPIIQIPLSITSTLSALAPPLPPSSSSSSTHLQPSQTVAPSQRMTSPEITPQSPEQVKLQLKAQLEYYFSRENLMTDRFLRCQMDNDQYVPIRIIANFPKVKRLTSDYNLVVKVLRESSQVQVDEKGQRVRAVSKRCTIILREIPESTDEKEVASMFVGGPPYLSLQYGLNNSWYVTFESEEATERAFLHLQNLGKTFNNKPICARIKTGGAPYSEPLNLMSGRSPSKVSSETLADPIVPLSIMPATPPCSSDSFDLGQILASYGYVPCATFKPGATVVHIASTSSSMGNQNMNHQRMRSSSNVRQTNLNFRGSNSRARGSYMYNQRICNSSYRDFNANSDYQCVSDRRNNNNRGDLSRDAYREKNNDSLIYVRYRGRQNRLNNYFGTVRSRTVAESQKSIQNENVLHRFDYDQSFGRNIMARQQRNKQKDMLSPGIWKSKCMLRPPTANILPDESKRNDEQQNSAREISDNDSKPETSSSKKTDDTEYSFEEGAFPCLSEEMSRKMEMKKEPEKLCEKPTFSSVAAGKRKEKKEPKEKKSYAQTLKQNNG